MSALPPSDDPKRDEESLRQRLMELHYDLLDDEEADELRLRIDQDATAARLWRETRVLAGKFADAARLDAASVTLERPAQTASSGRPDNDPFRSSLDADGRTSHVKRATEHADGETAPVGGNRDLRFWLGMLAVAAAVTVIVTATRYATSLPDSPGDMLQVTLQPVTGSEATARNEFFVAVGPSRPTTALSGFDRSAPIVPARISYEVVSDGIVLFFGSTETKPDAYGTIRVPDDVTIPGDAVLRVDAEPLEEAGEYVRLTVPLEPTRCLTYLSTDRPVYRPGETLYFRSVTLNRRTLTQHLEVPIRYELLDPSGATVDGLVSEGITERGVGNGAWTLPSSLAGGSYQLAAKSLDGFFPDQTCEIQIRAYRPVRLKTELEFGERSYGAGDRVTADLQVRRADDEIPTGAVARVSATVDDQVVHTAQDTLSEEGTLTVEFDLPGHLRSGEGTLSIAIDDGSVTETAVRPIPIHTGRAEIRFFPEGGYLVGGIQNRVYFDAHNRDGDPIEIAGEILSQAGRVVADVQTVRDGMGSFQFKPESGQRYSLRVTSPVDITETPWLPSVVEALPVLHTGSGVFEASEPLQMTVRSTKRRRVLARAVCRGELVGAQSVELGIGDNEVQVSLQERAHGVIRVTLLDLETDSKTATPLVERLVYRRDEERLKIRATVDGDQRVHAPGSPVQMTVHVTDENDQPVPGAVLGVSVVDDAALSLQQRESPSIGTHFLLTSEIESPEDLEHANFYLQASPEAAESLDLLLGTQGWRRFVSGSPQQFDMAFRDRLIRLLELDGNRDEIAGQPSSNASAIADRYRQYRTTVQQLWHRFLRELRWALMIIGTLWLIAFLIRPRRKAVSVAVVLLAGAVSLAILGCGGHQANEVITSGDAALDESFAEMATPPELIAEPGPAGSGKLQPPKSPSPEPGLIGRFAEYFLTRQSGAEKVDAGNARITAEQLRQWAAARGLDAQTMADRMMEELRFPIRQYAHLRRSSEPGIRSDFTETLYWNPAMVTDSTGTVSVRFELSDALTMFRLRAEGHAPGGRLGSGTGSVVTRLPVQVEPKLPLEVTAGDRIDLPVGVVNATGQDAAFEVGMQTGSDLQANEQATSVSLATDGRATTVFPVHVSNVSRPARSEVSVWARQSDGQASDQVRRHVSIVPSGFPFQLDRSGSLTDQASVAMNLPKAVSTDSLQGTITVFPNTRSQVSAGMESILREPHGCFEQASASNYPNVMAFQLMQVDGRVDDRFRRNTESLLRRGYRKLTQYECAQLGYEWFGNDPGHEALTAFGLMQFTEMAKVIDVDAEMLQRTRRWLLERRDGKGGFKRNPRHLHEWSLRQEVVDAYVLWSLSEADSQAGRPELTQQDFGPELQALERAAASSEDAYLIALAAITLDNVGRQSAARTLRQRLQTLQASDGSLTGETTVTQSGGVSRTAETTALAILAWADHPESQPHARSATGWLIDHRSGQGFGSTQATVLALKALIAMHKVLGNDESGSVEVRFAGEPVQTLRWQETPQEGVTLELPAAILARMQSEPGSQLTLHHSGPSSVPFTVQLTGRTSKPESDPECTIGIKVRLRSGEEDDQANPDSGDTFTMRAGQTANVQVEVVNRTQQGQPMTVAAVGLPGGLEPVIEDLERRREAGQIDYYELRGREVVLYWRTMAPAERKRVRFACVAEIAGHYSGPPSQAYLYYTAESRCWIDPLVATINNEQAVE
ncbi:hypothetical protein FYK55_15705 [Roseiconus nitratireducens]|uniref:Alpha-2-macroglobulin domain-containing protein n=1 Tax=Roseiconus nitratireducens TaxID=2605748 RepID=A0A5M6D670_9BACT|nr:MG2 domain-containing protein [Roseiconus nitratireducens]KAA5542246.1 hypothetical protein FYK55_15705 [Roseiconus nitratireducens]